MLKKLLIANRGEIAIRIARTAADLGVETLAIYSPDDARSLHVRHTDEAVELEGRGVAAYLDFEQIIKIAKRTGCDSIHPGYGLLSERMDFAAACEENGIVFVGPLAKTISQQGDKVLARALAKSANVPVTEGVDGIASADDVRTFFQSQGGAPIMLKAVNGGGGRGMRVVRNDGEIDAAFDQCRAEALGAFGEDALYAERFLPAVRHIEVQIVGDGNDVIHLWERDCSVQRRNQKIIELAPAPRLDSDLRANLLQSAVAIGKACNFRGLATVEFLVDCEASDANAYFFMETNPRIQVEHTVTEEVLGLDLVAIQLRVASGETLADIGLSQDSVGEPLGYAVQARINSESIAADGSVVPMSGQLSAFEPASGPGVRVDSYGYRGYTTNPNFDSLLAKLIVHSRSGDLATLMDRTVRALSEFHIGGLETNIPFLQALLELPQLRDWDVTVSGVEAKLKEIVASGIETGRTRYFEDASADAQAAHAVEEDYPEGSTPVLAPMQAVVVSLQLEEGATFQAGDVLAVIEAMKMQQEVRAESAGTVLRLLREPGDLVGAHQAILLVEEGESDGSDRKAEEEIDLDHIRPDLARLQERINATLDVTRPEAVERRRSRGQRTARENVADLCDPGSFAEYGQLAIAGQRRKRGVEALIKASPADGIITGIGTVNGDMPGSRKSSVAVLAYDATVMAGTQGIFGHKKTDRILEIALEQDLPLVFYTEGGGGRPNDDDFDDIIRSGLNIKTFSLLAQIDQPRIGVNAGFCFAGNAAVFASCDIKIAAKDSWIGLGGPAMVEAGGLGAYSPKEIGPSEVQAKTGLLDIVAEDEEQATALARQVLSYFQGPTESWEAADQRLLRHAIPENRKRVYDIHKVIHTLADSGSFLELKPDFCGGMITGLVRIEGHPMGLIANNPMHLGGALDAGASAKAASFITLCGKLDLPVISLCDTPGFMVGPDSEKQGGVGAAGSLISAGSRLETPIFFVTLRKGYGLGAMAMSGGGFTKPVFAISWPTGEFGPMGLEGGVELGYKTELDATETPAERQELFDRLVAKAYEEGGAINVASLTEIDAVIDPKDTREWIARGIAAC